MAMAMAMACWRRRQLRLLVGLLLLLLTVVPPKSYSCCARPLPLTTNNIILLHVASSGATPADMVMPRDDHHQGQLPAASGNKRYDYEWLLNRKPRGKPQPSAPSKRTN
ncbi:unnamed protein product [Urochloa humidicola]